MCKDQGKRTYESLASPDGPSFPCLLGHAQSRSMNDISRTPNTDQVVKPPHQAAVEGQGRKKPLVSGGREPLCTGLQSHEGAGVPRKNLDRGSGWPW